ncbi:MAG: site-2 protease family protein, partial [Candidatus Colwellbacteria bacterium]|nr:site-2 protease family protein [Candidatus Colwellbacteria bacterium]
MFFVIIFFFSILIIGHELGHFIAAKLAGIRVEEFGLGLPPRLVALRLGETTYSLNLFLIGGFVRLHGEGDGAAVDRARSFAHAGVFARGLVTLSGVAANFLLAWFALSLIFANGIPT